MSETVSIEGVVIDESDVTNIIDRGGWDAPEHRVEQGFDYSTYNNRDPIEVTIEAEIPREQYAELAEIRNREDPIDGASIGQAVLTKAKLQELETENQPTPENLVSVTLILKEVREGQTETAEVHIEIGDETQSSAADETSPERDQTDEEDGGDMEEETGGWVDSLADARKSLEGAVFG